MRTVILVTTFVTILCGPAWADEPPEIPPIPPLEGKAGELLTYDVDATGDPAPTFELTRGMSGMTIDSVTGVIEWIPGEDQGGQHGMRVKATNSAGSHETTFLVRITSASYFAPVLEPIPDQITTAEEWWSYDAEAIGIPRPSFSVLDDPSGMDTDSRTGVISWRPDWNQAGVYTLTVSASNYMGADRETFVLEVLPHIHTVTLTSTEGGAVTTPGEGAFEYEKNERVPIEATAEDGYRFLFWSGGKVLDRESPSSTMIISKDYTVLAIFESTTGPRHTLTLSSGDGGSVRTPGEGTFEYAEGLTVPIGARNSGGHAFVNWTGTAVDAGKVANPTGETTTVTMDADYTLRANFIRLYRLTIASRSGG